MYLLNNNCLCSYKDTIVISIVISPNSILVRRPPIIVIKNIHIIFLYINTYEYLKKSYWYLILNNNFIMKDEFGQF